MGRKAIEFDIDEARKILAETNSWRETGRRLGVHPYSVQRAMISLDIDIDRTVSRRKWDIKKARRLRANGVTYQNIARIMKVNVSTIHRALNRKK